MKKISWLTLGIILTVSCSDEKQSPNSNAYKEVVEDDYELSQPLNQSSAVLILFGGFNQSAIDMKREFKILERAKENNIAVLFMNYNQNLWMTEEEKRALKESVEDIFATNKLSTKDVFIGGFSSGGNITLLLSEYFISSKSSIQPKGLFVVDSPVDLLELYRLSQRNLARNISEGSVHEAARLIDAFNNELGNPENGINKYEAFSPYTSETNNIKNLSNIDGLKIRFYSEPDTLWWKENRNNEPTDLNAHWLKKIATRLESELYNSTVEFIATENKGYRANGARHPHSWSIVDEKDLMSWIFAK